MEIRNRVSFNIRGRAKVYDKLQKLGIQMKETGDRKIVSLIYFDINENDILWPEAEKIISSAGIGAIMTETVFTKEEIMSAEWVRIYPHHFCGYPMPDLHGEWRELSYYSERECKECGIELRQKAPIHLKSEPKLGRNHFMGIFWTYDIFARNEVFDVLSQNGITGFETYPAIHHKKKVPLETIKQLKILGELAPSVINDNLTRESYHCNHVKYLGLSRGMYRFSHNIFKDMPDLIKTHEWFGSGHEAIQLVLASSKFVKVYVENNWKGLRLEPIELL